MQSLSTQQHAYQSFLATSWFESVSVTVAYWVNFKEKHLYEHELQLSNKMYESSFAQMYIFLVKKNTFCIFA